MRGIDLSSMDFRKLSLTRLLQSFFECKSPGLESLSIKSSGISGHVPDQLVQFKDLVHLQLGSNDITGIIPDSIGRLSSLEVLDLSHNQVLGSIPHSIERLSLLNVLDLSSNGLNDTLPYSIGQLSSLKKLDLSNNQLNGSLPDSFGQLINLEYLDISHNLLTGVVTEAHFAKLAKLKFLIGTGNTLSLSPQHANWNPCFQLHDLYMNSWELGPQFPLWLQLQKKLRVVDISNTNISSPVPLSFWRSFPNTMMHLDMSKNHIQGTLIGIPATLDLDLLDLSCNNFIGQLPHLSLRSVGSFLDLSNNSIEGSLHHLLCPDVANDLFVLNLGYNLFSGVMPDCWEKWPRLQYLNIEQTNLFSGIPRTLGSLSNLESLNLHGNQLTGRLPASLENLKRLTILDLGGNELVGSIPRWLGTKLSMLRILNVRWNNFDGNIPHELCYLTWIQILDLSQNNLSGNIPICLNNLTTFCKNESTSNDIYQFSFGMSIETSKSIHGSDSFVIKGREDTYSTILGLVLLLDLSSNNFTGHIPSELTALRELHHLNFSKNQLTGRIPENIGNLKSLESFDVSLNHLSGELPVSLSSLSFLCSFNVSYNNLTGRVPSSTQLQSLNESSFIGNKLCGLPLTKLCTVETFDRGHKDDDGISHGVDWGFIISMVFGFIVGFWIIMGPLIISRSWRIAYFFFLSEVKYKVYDVMHKYCCNKFWFF